MATDVKTLQNAVAYNAGTLTGDTLDTQNFTAVLVWFTPGASYNGTATFQISPDGGTTWFAIDGYAFSEIETPINAVASPGATTLYLVLMPAPVLFRVLMSGGSQGTLTVKAARVYY